MKNSKLNDVEESMFYRIFLGRFFSHIIKLSYINAAPTVKSGLSISKKEKLLKLMKDLNDYRFIIVHIELKRLNM